MNISGLEACSLDLYTDIKDLQTKYPAPMVGKIMRVREMHQYIIANPTVSDKDFVAEHLNRFSMSRPVAYSELHILKALLPTLGKSSKEFHQWRFNEMILETYNRAKEKGNFKEMANAAAAYARYNSLEKEENADREELFRAIMVQPFVPTMDPRVLGIEPIKNLEARQKKLLEELSKESTGAEIVEFEDIDVEQLIKDESATPPTVL